MKTFSTTIGAIVLGSSAICFLTIVGALFGALSGWIVGWFFGETILGVLGKLGLHGVAMWQIGATAGWFGGFLKTKVEATVKAAS